MNQLPRQREQGYKRYREKGRDFFTTKRDIIVKDYFYLLYTLGSADDATATVCVLEKQVPSRSSGVCLRSLIFFLSFFF